MFYENSKSMLNSFDTGIKRIFSTNQKWVYLFKVILVKQFHLPMDFENVILMVVASLNKFRMQLHVVSKTGCITDQQNDFCRIIKRCA